MRLKDRQSKRRGFTLVEVLAAMAIFAIIIPVAMRGAALANSAAALARHRAEAATLGEEKLNEIMLGNSDTQGDFGPAFPLYHWSLQSGTRDLNMTELMLTVTWQERGQDRSLNISTLVYGGSSGAAGSGAGGGQ